MARKLDLKTYQFKCGKSWRKRQWVSHQIGDGTQTNKNLTDREAFHNLKQEQEASYLHNQNPKSTYPF